MGAVPKALQSQTATLTSPSRSVVMNSGAELVSSTSKNLERVVQALEKKGVELTPEGGVRPIPKKR